MFNDNCATSNFYLEIIVKKEQSMQSMNYCVTAAITIMDRQCYLWNNLKCRATKEKSRLRQKKTILPLLDIL